MNKAKRKHTRYAVEKKAINGRMIFAAEVEVQNISISGVSIRTDRRLNIGNSYVLRLQDRDKVIRVKGAVVWSSLTASRKNPNGDLVPVYTAGIKFMDVLNERVTEIINFIEGHKRGDDHRLSGLRFDISGQGKAVLNVPTVYKVKKLSLGGMLIESTNELKTGHKLGMAITLPGSETVKFTGRVASCRPLSDGGPDRHEIGIEFIGMSEADRETLKEFIVHLLYSTNEEPPPVTSG
jgi:Tfp pilus assembly protein PilZ